MDAVEMSCRPPSGEGMPAMKHVCSVHKKETSQLCAKALSHALMYDTSLSNSDCSKSMSVLLGVEMRLPSGDKEEAISTNVDDEGVRAAMAWRTYVA